MGIFNSRCPIKEGENIMSKHRSKHDNCCYGMPMGGYGYGMAGYGMTGGTGAAAGGGCGASNYGGWGIRWIYALLVLIVIVLQFARRDTPFVAATTGCDGVVTTAPTTGLLGAGGFADGQLIDRSVLFIIVVFLLILCAGCWGGGQSNYGAAGAAGLGYTGGSGY